jgi:hypothetical protein
MADIKSPIKEEVIRELERKSNDTIKVFNPSEEEFRFKWDGYLWSVPSSNEDRGYGKGMNILPRYLANHYVKHMTDHLINQDSEKVVAIAKRKYTGNDWPREEERIALRTNNPKLVEYYARILWVGKVRDFGLDLVKSEEEETNKGSLQPLHIDVLEKIEKEKGYVKSEEKKDEPVNDIISQISK